mmetsp:Transcript_46139/g.107525  ORF Transcript_46139/g.107525 Transcript_46139/m.107525 type:complete len:120 (-) Transcript_46139:197-556(-)
MAGQLVQVPSLERLALKVVSDHVEWYADITLPYGGTAKVLLQLAESGRLHADTLAPLLQGWSTAGDVHDALGTPLSAAALGCRGAQALAAQFLRHRALQPRARPVPRAQRLTSLAEAAR